VLILFGAGHVAEREILSGETPAFVADNNPDLQNSRILGVEILSPERLTALNGILQVIICTSSILDVQEQLHSLGISSAQISVSTYLGSAAQVYRLEQFCFRGFVSCGLPSSRKSLHGGGVYQVEENSSELKITKIFEGNCRNIELHGTRLDVACQGRGIVQICTKTLEVNNEIPIPKPASIHGIRRFGDHYYATDPESDSVLVLEQSGKVVNRYSISDKFATMGSPQHHVNDLYILNNSIYVSMFSLSGNWKNGIFDGGVVEVDMSTGNIRAVVDSLKMPHNVMFREDGEFYILDSLRGKILGYDRSDIGTLPGFTRGLAFSDNFIIVGESKNRNISKLERGEMLSSIDTRVTIVDPAIKASRSIPMPQGISEIHAIAPLSN